LKISRMAEGFRADRLSEILYSIGVCTNFRENINVQVTV